LVPRWVRERQRNQLLVVAVAGNLKISFVWLALGALFHFHDAVSALRDWITPVGQW